MPVDRSRDSHEAGSSTTELVLLMPVVLLLIMLIVQFGLWLHAQQIAAAAAQEGLVAAQAEFGTSAAGRDRATSFLTEAGGLRQVRVESERDATSVRVEVAGVTPAVIPGMALAVGAVAQGPVERFVGETSR
jgi:Flp pilus assembly protein TadG